MAINSRRKNAYVAREKAPEPVKSGMKISYAAQGMAADISIEAKAKNTFKLPKPLPGVVPKGNSMAMDSAMNDIYAFAAVNTAFSEGLEFMGYPYLAELTQRAEYRRPSEILAKEMTRKWIRLQCTGDEDKTDKLAAIESEMKRLGVQSAFCKAAEHDGFFGRSQIYLDMGVDTEKNKDELKTELVDSPSKIGKGSLKRLTVVEPMWTYPNFYNAFNPLDRTFFKPQSWFVMGTEVHSSRLLTFVSREVPDMLKPSYAFGGISLSQMAKPYVDNWLRTRQSVSDMVHSFSVSGLKTNLSATLNGGGGDEMFSRAQLFNQARDNRGMMMIDRDTEEFFNVSIPLSGLDKLQAQAQEQMSSVCSIPLSILLGITPSGLNASSDGEIETFYSWVQAQQEALFTDNLSRIINVIQLSLFGEIDPEIGFMFMPLWSLGEDELATVRKTEAETDAILITEGVITPQEARVRLSAQEDSPYASLDLAADIEPPEDPESGYNPLSGIGGK